MAKNDLSSSITALGLTADEQPDTDIKILGFKPKTWLKDIENKLAEIRQNTRLEKLYKAQEVLTRNLSADDKFDLDTAGIDELIA